ncbi:MAG: flagellar biosynthetic protein FliR [Pseudomonadota bacterium]
MPLAADMIGDDQLASYVLGVAVLFARIGGIFLIAPGLSSVRAPVRVRVFLALGITLALAPPLVAEAAASVSERTPAAIVRVIATETMVGFFIGLMARLLMMALQTMAVAIANMVGLGGIPGLTMDGNEPAQAAAAIFTATALVIIFLADIHHEIIRAAVGSYGVLPAGAAFDPRTALADVAERAGEAFMVALRLAAPFVIYSLIVNFAVGLTNKLTPQVPVFFVALPIVTAGGLLVIAYSIREVMFAFQVAMRALVQAL